MMDSFGFTSPSNLPSVGMLSLATSMPDRILTNDYWRENHPEVIAEVEKRLRKILKKMFRDFPPE